MLSPLRRWRERRTEHTETADDQAVATPDRLITREERPWLRDEDIAALNDMLTRCDQPEAVNLAIVKAARDGDDTPEGMKDALEALYNRTLPQPTEEDLTSCAAHEAGHVVVAVAMGLSVLFSDIVPSGSSAGHTATYVHDEKSPEVLWAGMVTAMGGAICEHMLTGTSDVRGASADLEEVQTMALGLQLSRFTDLQAHELISAAMNLATRILADSREPAVRLAQALLDVGSLNALDIQRLVADVPFAGAPLVNPPVRAQRAA